MAVSEQPTKKPPPNSPHNRTSRLDQYLGMSLYAFLPVEGRHWRGFADTILALLNRDFSFLSIPAAKNPLTLATFLTKEKRLMFQLGYVFYTL